MIGLIWAQAANGVVGRDGGIPWHLPEDLAQFRRVTEGATVVMGRRTWQSLPPQFRPLPGRRNVVLTTDAQWTSEGVLVAQDLDEALSMPGDVWVIGGASVWAAAEPSATVAVVTELAEEFDGDVYAPAFGEQWQLSRDGRWQTSARGLHYRVRRYVRTG